MITYVCNCEYILYFIYSGVLQIESIQNILIAYYEFLILGDNTVLHCSLCLYSAVSMKNFHTAKVILKYYHESFIIALFILIIALHGYHHM